MILDETYWHDLPERAGGPAPWGLFDNDARLRFQFDFSPWVLTGGEALTLTGAVALASAELTFDEISLTAEGTVRIRVKKTDEAAAPTSTYTPFTLRLTLSDGQHDDRTFWLKIAQR